MEVMGERPAIDSRHYIVAFELRSTDDCPPDFELPSSLAGFDAGLFLPRDDPDWFGRSCISAAHPASEGRCAAYRFAPEHRGAALPMGHGADRFGRIGAYASERVAPLHRIRIRLHGPLQYPRFPIGLSVHAPLPGRVAAWRPATRTPRGPSRSRPRYQIRQRPGAGTGLRRNHFDAGFPTAEEAEIQKLVASAPPLDRGRFAGADRPAAAVDYGPGEGILFAIREHRFVCSIGRRASIGLTSGRGGHDSPSGPERRFRVAGSDRVAKAARIASELAEDFAAALEIQKRRNEA